MKIIHWDYTEGSGGVELVSNDTLAFHGAIRDRDNDEVRGFYIRWQVRLYSESGIFLSCIMEDPYRLEGAPSLSTKDLLILMNYSLFKFKRKLYEEIEKIGFTLQVSFDLTEDMAELLRYELNRPPRE